MKEMPRGLIAVMVSSLVRVCTSSDEVSTETLESITTPDEVETSIGTLNFMDGAPLPETAQKGYDYLGTMRGVKIEIDVGGFFFDGRASGILSKEQCQNLTRDYRSQIGDGLPDILAAFSSKPIPGAIIS